jgi:hypothetical protein
MQRIPVASSSIASIGYAPRERVLELEFRQSGEVYQYFDVPAEEYTAFLAADSKGTYMNQQLNHGDTAISGSRPHRNSFPILSSSVLAIVHLLFTWTLNHQLIRTLSIWPPGRSRRCCNTSLHTRK